METITFDYQDRHGKQLIILAMALLTLLLAGCGGDVLSPASYDSHAVTTTTTTTATAELAQKDNRPVCVGLIVLGSCNTTATQTQHAAPAASVAPAPATLGAAPTLGDICLWLLICAMCCALFCALIGGIKWIFRDEYAES